MRMISAYVAKFLGHEVLEVMVKAFKKLSYPHEYSSAAAYITVSGGISGMQGNATPEALIKSADTSLYQVKKSSRNNVAL